MPYDLKRSHFSLTLQKDVASGQVVDREGVLLRSVLESGNEKVQKADAGASTYALAGFAISDNETVGIIPVVEDLTIPAAPGPYTVTLKYPIEGTAPNSSARVMVVGGADLTEVAGAPAATQFQPTVATGVLTFNVAEAGSAIRVWYRATLTVAQAKLLFFERSVNNSAGSTFNTVAVGSGTGEVYTAEYDTNVDWSTAVPGGAGVISSGADGILTIGGAGTALPGGKVVHVPDVDQPYLGVAFNLPG